MIECYAFKELGASAMTDTEMIELKTAIYAAFVEAIKSVGIEAFKSTSLFGSNDQKVVASAA
jgi:hypothetical protein